MSLFPRALKLVLAHEGGYVNHPRDPGGETNFGITRRVYDAFRRSVGAPVRSVRHITSNEVETIYRRDYWLPVRGDALPAGVGYATFDGAVNSGVSRGSRWLQRAIGAVADGNVGPRTVASAMTNDPVQTIQRMCADRMGFLRGLSTFSTFGRGWTRRVAGVEADGVAMAVAAHGQDPRQIAASESKAAGDRSKAEAAGSAGAAGGSGAAGTQIDPNVFDMSNGVLVLVVVVAAALAIILLARSRVSRIRSQAYADVVAGGVA